MGDIEMLKFEEYWTENASKESCTNKSVAWRIWESKQAEIDQLKVERTLQKEKIRLHKDLMDVKDIEIKELESEWLEMHNDNKQVNKDAMDSQKELYTLKKLMEVKDKEIAELEKRCISYKYQRDESNHKLMIKSAQYSSIQEHLAALKDRLDVAYNMATKKTFNPLGQLRKVISSLESKDE